MKQLILVRHAKSDWGKEGLNDIDRHLNERGYSDAYHMSTWFIQHYNNPDLVLSSDATRALSTAMIFMRNLQMDTAKLEIDPQIYESNVVKLKEVLSRIDNKHSSVMMFGHNPSITNLANDLNNEMLFDEIPTCGIVCIEFDAKNWKDINNGKLKYNHFPKEFK